jgi:hydroxypyruvate isomerase
MKRRTFARTLIGTAVGGALLPHAYARATKEALPFQLSVMLWTVLRDHPFEYRLEKVAEAGYHAVELVNEFEKWTDDDFQQANRTKRSLGITFDASAGIRKGVADPAAREAFLNELKTFLPTVDKLECPAIIVLSGNRIEGLSHEAQHQACIETLKSAGDIAAKQNLTLLLENIDPEENPKYFLTSVAEGFEIVRSVGNPHVKFLYDFYHEQIAEGNLIEKLEKNIQQVGVVHIADVPGRHEPGTGEINYETIFRKLGELKFPGYAAMEFLPSGDPVSSLRSARELALRAASQPLRSDLTGWSHRFNLPTETTQG